MHVRSSAWWLCLVPVFALSAACGGDEPEEPVAAARRKPKAKGGAAGEATETGSGSSGKGGKGGNDGGGAPASGGAGAGGNTSPAGGGGTGGTGGTAGGSGTAGKAGTGGTGGKGGTAGKGGAAGSGTMPDQGPCKGVPSGGICVDATKVRRCSAPTGSSVPTLVDEVCPATKQCVATAEQAACRTKPGACEPGTSECDPMNPNQDRFCSLTGAWETGPCPACESSPAGSVCQSATGTKPYPLTVLYGFKSANAGLTDWDPQVGEIPLPFALAVSYKAEGTDFVAIDSQFLDLDGKATLNVPAVPKEGDSIYVFAISPTEDGKSVQFGVYEPKVGAGEQDVSKPIEEADPWSWAIDVSKAPATGAVMHITPELGSGVLRVFDYLRYAYLSTSNLLAAPGKPLVVWMKQNTSWNCGACADTTEASFQDFKAQIWFPMTAADESYWSDPVTAHELGHWMQGSYSKLPDEAGPHYVGCTSPPGLAWCEGWATYFSSITRGDPRYYDKQEGFFFSYDVDKRVYSGGAPWERPTADKGILQHLDENEVSAMLWSMSTKVGPQDDMLGPNLQFLKSLDKQRAAKPLRGYIAKAYQMNPDCSLADVQSTGEATLCFADYLDALVCSGTPKATIDGATQPATNYPYPSGQAVCQ